MSSANIHDSTHEDNTVEMYECELYVEAVLYAEH